MDAVRRAEEARGCRVVDVSAQKCGWDITSYPPAVDGKQPEARHIEVKGRVKGATTVTVTRNEMLYAFNQGDKFVLAIVLVGEDDSVEGPHYVRNPFDGEPGWGVSSVNYDLSDLLETSRGTMTMSHPVKSPRKAHRSRAAARCDQRGGGAGEIDPPRASVHACISGGRGGRWRRRGRSSSRSSSMIPETSGGGRTSGTEPNKQVKGHWTKARARLFKIIEDLVLWENTTNEEVLEPARAEIRRRGGRCAN